MALTLKNNYCEICDGFVRKLVEIMVMFTYTYLQRYDMEEPMGLNMKGVGIQKKTGDKKCKGTREWRFIKIHVETECV